MRLKLVACCQVDQSGFSRMFEAQADPSFLVSENDILMRNMTKILPEPDSIDNQIILPSHRESSYLASHQTFVFPCRTRQSHAEEGGGSASAWAEVNQLMQSPGGHPPPTPINSRRNINRRGSSQSFPLSFPRHPNIRLDDDQCRQLAGQPRPPFWVQVLASGRTNSATNSMK